MEIWNSEMSLLQDTIIIHEMMWYFWKFYKLTKSVIQNINNDIWDQSLTNQCMMGSDCMKNIVPSQQNRR